MIKKTGVTKGLSKKIYLTEGILIIGWLIYLTAFYFFYTEAYFYVDKRMTLFLRLLSFLDNNWTGAMMYFVIGFLLLLGTFYFFGVTLLLKTKKTLNQKKLYTLYAINSLFGLVLLFNVAGSVFLVLSILSGSVVYITFILAKETTKDTYSYEVDDVLETIGPFKTEEIALQHAQEFLDQWATEQKILLNKDIYIEIDNQYYVEIYVEAVNSNRSL